MKTVIRTDKTIPAEYAEVGKTYLLKNTNSYYLRIELDKDFMKEVSRHLIPFLILNENVPTVSIFNEGSEFVEMPHESVITI